MTDHIDIVFDGPPQPEAGRFIEVEDPNGASISVGRWVDRGDGTWALRLDSAAIRPHPCTLCEGRPRVPGLRKSQTRE